MRAMVRVVVAAGVAAVLTVTAAIAFVRTPEASRPDASATGQAPSSSVFLLPAPGAGSLEASISSLQKRLRVRPGDSRGFASLGLAYVAQARMTADPSWYPKAEGVLQESLRLHAADNVEALLGLGALELARHDFASALERGRAAQELDPYDADVYGVQGDALVELGRYDEAFATFQTMVDTRPDIASYARASYARELMGDVLGAMDAMRTAFDAAGLPADAAWAAFQLGELEFGRGSLATAADWYRRGLDLAPTYVPNLAGMAKVAWARGDAGLAIRRYRAAVAAYPSVEYVAALGDLFATIGREDLAREQYAVVQATRSLAQANGVNVDLEIALFDADHGDPEGALAAAEAEWARRNSVHVADAYAWALYANGRYEEAARIQRRALRLGTRSALFLFHAGMIELAKGNDDDALRLLRRAVATDPSFSILHARTAERTLHDLEAEL